ncbi:DUF1311 domain-containing protein [Mesorhizobium sp. WSM4935]|nr:DUF1311 domain-containing protein [Mesorhizobium sp. WSM4935]
MRRGAMAAWGRVVASAWSFATKLAGHEPASCINYVTELCSFESDDGRSQLGLIDCANREVSVWENRLNTTYAALVAKAAPKARDGYRNMQRAWIAYRDARCKAEASAETINSDRQSKIIVSCELDATARQALILDDELSDISPRSGQHAAEGMNVQAACDGELHQCRSRKSTIKDAA